MPEMDLPAGPPSEPEIRAALARVLASPHFRTAPQLSSFLRFVIEKTLAGQADRIKGYSIAVGALGRSDNFDPQTNAIVRVEAGRLRRALERHYAGPGLQDEIVIDLPVGGYVPTFERRRLGLNMQRGRWVSLRAAAGHRFGLAAFVACVAAASAALYLIIMPAERVVAGRVTPLNTFAGPYWTATAVLCAVTIVSIIFGWWIGRN